MNPLLALLLAAGAVAVLRRKQVVAVGAMQQAIAAEASRQGVDPAVALLFADLESGFKNVTGDSWWPAKKLPDGRTNWEVYVRDNPAFTNNPYRDVPPLWISYGPFQLLSPFSLPDPKADPRLLFELAVNIRLGVAKIKQLSKLYGGNLVKMRLAYVCGSATGCSSKRTAEITAQLKAKASKYDLG